MNSEVSSELSQKIFSKSGPPLIGIIFNWWLYGVLLMQYFMYIRYPKYNVPKYVGGIVHLLLVLNTVQTVMTMVDAFQWFVYLNFGDYGALFEVGTASINSPFMDGVIALIVQLVYAWRIRSLSGWIVIPCLIAFVALVGGVSGMLTGIYGQIVPQAELRVRLPALLWLWSNVVTDIFIAVSTSYPVRAIKAV
ncbi:hypothetical protein D9756_009090 [Leucocoprinus leucothites]|uniref:Uncharacterized protein n=1 Tax=Leucocoprinus leucothites TaxID=201217 RepID=A0A8H5CYX2_9AGAR|nr:hypothetical protein D9756_009090 [Leucoagaricus leucothites]